jgi:hypothetical protein
MPKFIIHIDKAVPNTFIEDVKVECFLLSSNLPQDYMESVSKLISNQRKLLLFEGDNAVGLCKKFGADGVVKDLTNSNNLKKDILSLRKELGSCVLGIVSRNRRHEAMIVSENEPDFIIFKVWAQGKEQTIALSKWYSELFLIPQAISLEDDDANFNDYNADMVIITPKRFKILVA